jgi:hypothetical protein
MSKNVTVRGVKFKIVPTVPDADHAELGLYQNGDGTQEIRWSEAPITGVTVGGVAQAWKSGTLCQIGTLDRNLPTGNGGSQEEYSGLSIVVANGNKLILRLKELGIVLNGKTAELWEFEGTDADADATSAVTYFHGTAAYELNSTWDERLWNIEITNNRYRRNAFFGTVINNDPTNGNYPDASDDDNGKTVPATFGTFKIEVDGRVNPAKFLRVAGKQRLLTNSDYLDSGKYCSPVDQSSYPVVSNFCGLTSSGSAVINLWSGTAAGYFSVGDHINLTAGFADLTDRTISTVDAVNGTITLSGDAANSSTIALIDFLHKADEANTTCLAYTIKLGLSRTGAFSSPPAADNMQGFIDNLVNKWANVVKGGSADGTALSGKYRKIDHCQVADWTAGGAAAECLVTVFLSSVFDKNLSGNPTATATNQAWLSFSYLPMAHANDVWPCSGFLDGSGTVNSKLQKLYIYKNDSTFLEKKQYKVDDDDNLIISSSAAPIGFKEIAPFGYNASGSNGNLVVIDALHYENDPENLISFDVFPMLGVDRIATENLAQYGYDLFAWKADGLYEGSGATIYNISYTHAGSSAGAVDKSDVSYDKHTFTFGIQTLVGVNLKMAFETSIDFSKLLHEYDGFYLGINAETHVGDGGDGYAHSPFRIKSRGFMGSSEDIILGSLGDKYLDEDQGAAYGGRINSLPDFYYSVRTVDNNRAFLFSPTEAGQMRLISGHQCFPIPNSQTVAALKSIYKIGLLFSIVNNANKLACTSSAKFTELALICKTSGSISNCLYTLCAGRIFNDTWSGRKTAADMITNPVDFIEHFLRLQWGGDLGDVVEYGKAYSAHMPIKTGTDTNHDNGSFDSTILTEVKTFSPSWQVPDKEAAYTDVQIGNLCRTFDLCLYTDLSGNICITTMDKTNPSETITFNDIKGKIGWTKEPQIRNVYCQPYFNYGYNYGSGKFDRLMGVLNVQAASYDPSYTPGIDNTQYLLDPLEETSDGEYIWNACRALYLKYGQIERCPSSFSDQKMLTKYEDTVKIFYKKIIGQSRLRQSLNVSYEKGRYYHPGKHVKIKLPHQTLNLSVEVMIERIKVGRYDENIALDVVLLEDIPTAFFFE